MECEKAQYGNGLDGVDNSAGSGPSFSETSSGGPGWLRFQKRGPGLPLIDVDANNNHESSDDFSEGDRCFHQKFGMGIISDLEGDHLTIKFDRAGTKKVIAAFVKKH